jgi:hypothetical protein
MARDNERVQDIELIERIKKLMRDVTELEHRVLMLERIVEKRRRLIELIAERYLRNVNNQDNS